MNHFLLDEFLARIFEEKGNIYLIIARKEDSTEAQISAIRCYNTAMRIMNMSGQPNNRLTMVE